MADPMLFHRTLSPRGFDAEAAHFSSTVESLGACLPWCALLLAEWPHLYYVLLCYYFGSRYDKSLRQDNMSCIGGTVDCVINCLLYCSNVIIFLDFRGVMLLLCMSECGL